MNNIGVFKISHHPSHPMATYLIAMPSLTLLKSQSQQNAADTASAMSTSQDPTSTSQPIENTEY